MDILKINTEAVYCVGDLHGNFNDILFFIKSKDIKKNIVRPSIVMFKQLYMKSLEEFHLHPTYHDLVELYYFFKKSKMMYRLSIDKFNL